MAASAIDGQGQKRLADGADHLFDFFLPNAGFEQSAGGSVARFVIRRSHQESGGNNALARSWPQRIARDLFFDELKVRFVVVETLDDIIPVTPGILPDFVVLESVAFG